MGALVEIEDVDVRRVGKHGLVGANLELPQASSVLDTDAVDFGGWALGDGLKAVEVRAEGSLIASVPLGIERPDLARALPDHPHAGRAGFRSTLDLTPAPPRFELDVVAARGEGEPITIATIRGHHRWRQQAAPAFAQLASVAIACRDEPKLLAETIESVLAQSYPHLEVVVVDDSRDGRPREISTGYEGVRVVAAEPEEVDLRNEGIRHTNGDYLVFAESGDRFLPHALERAIRDLEAHPEQPFVRARARPISLDGSPLPMPDRRDEGDVYEVLLRGGRPDPAAATVYRRAVFEDVTPFDPVFGPAANLDLDLRIAHRYGGGLSDEVVVEYRLSPENANEMRRVGLKVLKAQRKTARADGRRHAQRAGSDAWRGYWQDAAASLAR